jgi:hypothetical protein
MTGHVTAAMTEHYSHVGRAEKATAVSLALAVPTAAPIVGMGGDRVGIASLEGLPRSLTPQRKTPSWRAFRRLAHPGSNRGPLPCQGSALPLSYVPVRGRGW